MKKRILSFILAAVLTTQMVGTTVFAEQDAVGELSTVADNDCEFAFSAAQYVLSEAEGNYEITVKRNGSADFAADAAVKLIDIQSEYGTDYLVYDEDGNPLQKMSGTEILQSDEGMIDEFAEEHQDFSADNEDKDEDEAQNESSITTAASARAALFGMDTESTEKAAAAETENNVEKSLKTMYDGLNEAEGVLCKVSFEKGQTEKTFTIEILDNDLPQADRVVLMALMASTEGSISANGTAVLTIEDDEEYEKPIISVESDVTANPKTGTAEVVLKRETGVNYYTSVNAYTYSESAVAGEDFVSIDGEQICFVPGETEKTVSVQIKDFSENAQLGLRIEPDTTCGVAANADRAVIYIEADRLEDNEETVEINAYEQEEIRPFFSEAGFYGLQSMSEDILGTPYVEIGANEWVAGPYTQIQRDRGGNLWAVSRPDDPLNVLVNEQYRFIAYVVLTDEKGLLEMPGTTAKVSLSTTGMNNLKSNLKYEARETLNKASYSAFSTSDKKNYTASPYISHKYTPNISGNVSFLSRWGDQNYPGGLAIMKGYKVFPLMPMKLYYRVFTADYVTFDNFKDTRYDLSDGKYTEKPILGSEYTPPVMYLYDNDRNIVRNYYASASTDVFFNSYETEAKTSELYKRGIRPNKLKLFPFHTADLETVELKNTNKTSLPVSFAGMVKSEYTRIKANISFKDTDRAKFVYKDDISAYVGEEVKIRALVESASDRIVNFIAVPVYKNSDGSEYSKYEWSSDISCVNGEALFNVPPVRIENEDNFVRFDIIPQVEECKVIVKPIFYDGNKDGENDFILPDGVENYEGVVMVQSALNENSEETVQKTDADGNMSFKVTPHAPVILKAVCPAGYTVTWWDLSGDLNGDGIIDNDEIAEGQLDDSGQRYFTVSGDVYCGSAWNGSTTIGYGFKKKTLDTSGIRKGTVRIDTRSFYDLVINNSTKIPAGNLKPVSGVNVTIGGVSAKTDANGNFEMDMSDSNIEADGNIAPMLTYSDGGSSRTVYVGNIAPERFRSDLRIPSYDVYMPKSLTVRYNGEDILRDNTILIKDKILIVQAQVEMPENGAADVLTGADFTIVDENGRVRENCDFTARQAEQAELIEKAIDEWKKKNSSRDWDKLDEADKGLYLVGRTVQNADGDDKVIDCYTGFDRITNKATLVLNPQKFASTNDRIFISYKDDQRNYRRMNLGYTFLKPPSMGRFIMGAIGSTSTSDSITLLGIPMLNFDMGEIEGFTQTTGKIKGAPTIKDGADYQQTYNAVRFGYGKVMNFDNNETFGGWWNYGTQFETDKPNTSASDTASSEGNNKSDNTKPVENEEEPKDKNQKNSSVGLGEGDSAGSTDPSRVNTLYNYTLTPEFGFEMVLSSRGKNKDGTDRYGFECLRANLSVTGHYDVLITIDLVKLIAIEIQPKIDVNITGVYMLRSTYDDEINLEPVIEFGGDNSGFRPFSKSAIYENTRSYGYLGINPTLTIEAGLKIAIIRVKISASFDFDFDFLFDSQAADKTYGMMTYKTTLRVMLFSFDVFTMDMHNPVKVHLFGENEPLEIPTIDNSGVLASYDDGEKANAASVEMAILSAIEETIENSVVTQSDRSYLSERSGWLDGGIRLFAANDNTEPKTLQEGTAEYGSMQSVRFGDDDIFAVYIDDVPERGDVNRYALYYTCSTDGGNTWEAPQIIDDDGTLDDYPSLCQLNDGNILITWSSADSILDSNAGINDALGSMNLKSAVFNTDNMKMGTVMQITNTTEGGTSSDTYSAPAPFLNSNGDMIYRVYYLKADYNILSTESSEVMNSLTTTESIIAYRDYNTATGEWSEEYTEEQQITLSENGIDPEEYEAQWYGQQFVDTRMGTDSFNYITEIAACSTGGISYLAYIVDWDKDMKTTEDRDVFAMCNDNVGDAGSDDPNYKLPVRITDKTGSYSELEFASGTGEAMLFFHSDGFITYDADGNAQRASGIAYADIASTFQHGESGDSYAPTLRTVEGGGYREFWYIANQLNENYDTIVTELRVPPSEAVLAPYNDFAVCTDKTGRAYIVWTQPDSATNKMTLFGAVYNLPPETQSDDSLSVVGWSEPVPLLTDTSIRCGEFTVQSVNEGEASEKLRLLFKGEKESGKTDLMTAAHTPSGDVKIDRIGMSSDYLYDDSEVIFSTFLSNHGLAADRTVCTENSDGIKYLAPDFGTYVTEFWINTNGEKKRIGAKIYNDVFNPSQSIFASCTYTQEGSVPDNTKIEVRLFDASDTLWTSEEDITEDCAEFGLRLIDENEFIIEKKAEISTDTMSVKEYNSRETDVLFEVSNNGNIAANATAVISAVKDGNSEELKKVDIGSLDAQRMTQQRIRVQIPENMLTEDETDSTLQHYTLELKLCVGGETLAVRSAQGAVRYNKAASEILSDVDKVDFGSENMSLKIDEVKQISNDIINQSGDESSVRLVSSDSSILRVSGNSVIGVKAGEATLTAYAVPNINITQINSFGVGEELDVLEEIPESLIKKDEITVTVKSSSASSGGGGSVATTYTVTFETNGGSKVNSIKVAKNNAVTEPTAPTKDGYTFGGWYIDKELSTAYSFGEKVTKSFTLYAKWTDETQQNGEWSNPFVDVNKSDWYYDSIKFAYENKLFSGISDTEFAPQNMMTRAMLVTVLYRAEGEPDMENEIWGYPFADVDAESWYGKAVYWARKNGVVNGVTENDFAPDSNITREQIAVIMHRYAKYKGYDVSVGESTNIHSYTDFDEISEYAISAMQWAVGSGLMKGKTESTINPKDVATRAEIAAILQRFIEANK